MLDPTAFPGLRAGDRYYPPIAGGSETEAWQERITRELSQHFGEQVRRLDGAAERFQGQAARLLRPDGSRLYADPEHEERTAALLEEFDQATATVAEDVEAAIAEAERGLARLAGADPLASLPAADLARAATRQSFVREDVSDLPSERLVARARAVVAEGDRVEQLLMVRYLPARLATLAASDPARLALLGLQRELEERTGNPDAAEQRHALERKVELGKLLRRRPRDLRSRLDGTTARAQASLSATYGRF